MSIYSRCAVYFCCTKPFAICSEQCRNLQLS